MNIMPVLLLDVDGVVNASRAGWQRQPYRTRVSVDGIEYKIRWEPQVVDFFWELYNNNLVEIRWLTTWGIHANKILAPAISMPQGLYAYMPPQRPTRPHPWVKGEVVSGNLPHDWKLSHALTVITKEQRPLIWIDDEAVHIVSRKKIAKVENRIPSLLINPQPSRGIRLEHTQMVKEFVNSLLKRE